jgi:hypothetical protein
LRFLSENYAKLCWNHFYFSYVFMQSQVAILNLSAVVAAAVHYQRSRVTFCSA